MTDFLKLPVVKSQLRVTHGEDDEVLEWCIEKAVAIVIDYLKTDEASFFVGSPGVLTLPFHVEAAMVLVVEQLYDGNSIDPISPAARSLLERSRDPAVA